jgi:hypothetical protein
MFKLSVYQVAPPKRKNEHDKSRQTLASLMILRTAYRSILRTKPLNYVHGIKRFKWQKDPHMIWLRSSNVRAKSYAYLSGLPAGGPSGISTNCLANSDATTFGPSPSISTLRSHSRALTVSKVEWKWSRRVPLTPS